MYVVIIVLLLGVCPAFSILFEIFSLGTTSSLIFLVGKWFSFWAVGVRLLLAGLRQTFNPAFTAQEIFAVEDRAAQKIVRELGFANLSLGALGTLSLLNSSWIVPSALCGGLFYGLAGINHAMSKDRNSNQTVAMLSDLFIFVVMLGFLIATFRHAWI